MKKLLLIYSIILILQGGVNLFASVKVNFAELILKEKNESNFWIENQNLINQNAGIQKIKSANEAPFTSSWNIDISTTTLSYCGGASKYIPLLITPKDTTLATYRIEWGDGDFTAGNYQLIKSRPHVYSTYGEYTVTMTFGNNPPFQYIAYYGLAPSVKIIGPQLNQYCVGDSIELKVFGTENNPKGTKYELIFTNRPDSVLRFGENNPLPQTLKHVFKQIGSCGFIYRTGDGKSYENAFGVIIKAINPCSPPNGVPDQAGPYYVSSVPKFNNKRDTIKTCVNKTIKINNLDEAKTTPFVDAQGISTCQSSFKKRWIITPGSGWVLNPNQTLGYTTNPTSPNNPNFWENGSTELDITFTQAGLYEITALLANQCFTERVPQFIKVDPIINPQINEISKTDICGNIKIALENTTPINPADYTGTPKFYWTVSSPGKFINNTDRNSLKPEFELPQRGVYTITLTYTGTSCDDVSTTVNYTVRGAPTVSINPMDTCLSGSSVDIKATATINDFGERPTAYRWTIKNSNGTEIFTDTNEEPIFTFNQIGVYTVQLEIVNSCGPTTTSRTFEIEPQPTISSVSSLTVCENKVIPTINFNVLNASQGIRWVNSNTAIGLPQSGTSTSGNEQLPSFKALNPGNTPISATITVYPLNIGCQGNPISFTITVNPSKDTGLHKKYEYCYGEPITDIKVLYNGIESNVAASYQWYRYKRGENGVPIPNETSATLKPLNIVDTIYYYCEITGCGGAIIKSNPDTIIIHPAAIISDYSRLCKSGVPANFTPINGTDGSIPMQTTYTWKIDIANTDPRVIGASDNLIPVSAIYDTLSLPEGFNEAFVMVKYLVTAKTGKCEETFTIDVKVIPNITADIKLIPIKCYGGTGSIDISNIVGIIGKNTQIELWKNQVKESEVIISDTKYNFPGLLKGNYKIIIIDKDNYLPGSEFVMDNLILGEPEQIAISSNIKNVTCFGAKDGSINVTVTGGTLNSGNSYKYKWEQNTGTGWQIYTDYVNWKSITELVRGFYRLTVTDDNNCLDQKEFFVSEPNPLNFDHVSFSIEDCDGVLNPSGKIVVSNPRGGTVMYSSNYQFKYRQNNVETSYMNIDEINSKLSNIQEGKYFVTLKDDNNCEFTKEININRIPALVAFINSDIIYDCGNTITRKYTVTVWGGVPQYSVKWFAGNNEIGSGFEYTPPREYNNVNITVKVTDQRNCIYTLVLDAFQADVPIFDWYYKKKPGCNEYEFIAQISDVIGSNYEFVWDFGRGEEITKSMSITRNLDGYPVNSATGNFEVSLKILRFGCAYPVNVKTIPQNSVPNIELIQNGASEVNDVYWFCKGDTITVTATGASSYSWSTNSKSNSIRIYDEGIYTVWGINGIGCLSKRTFETKFYNQPFSIIATPQEIELGETIKFSVEPIIPFTQEYKWNFGDGTTGSSSESFIEHLYKTFTQDYFNVQVKVITREGCTEEASTSVKVNIENIPNTIIPEGSMESNRIFMPGCRVQVYNRNGVLIHQGDNGWDGKYNGKIVASDTYFYILTYSSKGKLQTRTGYVTVLR